jgi:branched-chain amino acid aminotransferase
VSLSAPPSTPASWRASRRGRRAATRVILLRPLPADLARDLARGIGARTFREERATGPIAAIKATSYLPSVIALRAARRAGAREAIFVAPSGQVREGAASSVFARVGNAMITPPADGRILPGIMRALILALARKEALPVRERTLRAADLERAREIFITNAVREIVPVVRLDGRPVGTGKPGPLTRAVGMAWERYKGGRSMTRA